jgi:hypothetical protein
MKEVLPSIFVLAARELRATPNPFLRVCAILGSEWREGNGNDGFPGFLRCNVAQ